MRGRVLLVHENVEILERLTGLLRESGEPVELHAVADPGEAAACLEDEGFDVVAVSPGLGVESGAVFGAASARSPEAVRILITDRGLAPDEAIPSVPTAHQFLPADGEREDIVEALESAFRVRELLGDARLREVVSRIRALPSLPALYLDIVRELRSPDPSIARVARIIGDDIGMAAKTLQLVNSVAFAPRNRITDPMRAAIYLGTDTLKALVLSAKVFAQFERIDVAEIAIGELWDHSMFVASLARRIAERECEKATADSAFLAGVLHDIGKLVLAANLPDGSLQAARLSKEHGIGVDAAEGIVFGATHAQVGAYLMALWGLPGPVVDAIRLHHTPPEPSRDDPLDERTILYVANALDHERREAVGGERSDGGVTRGNPDGAREGVDRFAFLASTGFANRLDAWREIRDTV